MSNTTKLWNRIFIICACIIAVTLLWRTGEFIYSLGYFRNENPNLILPSSVQSIAWSFLCLAIILPCIGLVVLFVVKKNIWIYILSALIAMSIIFSVCQTSFSVFAEENNAVSKLGNTENPYFNEITLNMLNEYLQDDSGKEVILYIARNDCKECFIFDNEITPQLERLHYGLTVYYTNSDREGPRSKEMYELLDKYGIATVPSVLVIKNAKVVQMWDDPSNALNEIVIHLSK